MGANTSIEWTNSTWNPVVGCTKVSPGCAYCYAERLTLRRGGKAFLPGKAQIILHPERLNQPQHWRQPRRIFVCSMSDLFHEEVPDEFLVNIFEKMEYASWHVFQVLTKRPERMRDFLQSWCGIDGAAEHIWVGVSVENQRMADLRIPVLLETPAAVRFVSCEPLLSAIDLRHWIGYGRGEQSGFRGQLQNDLEDSSRSAVEPSRFWVICGGESGGPERRRLVQPCGRGWEPKAKAIDWLRSLRDQCLVAGVPFFFKQYPIPPYKAGGPALLDGREWREWPDG